MRELFCRRFFWNRGYVGDGKGYAVKFSVKLLFEIRDWWVGIYVDNTERDHLRVYVCLVPLLPIRFHYMHSYGGKFGGSP